MHFLYSSPAFNDTIDSLSNEFKNDNSNNLIICGAQDFSKYKNINEYKNKYDKVIVFNQEPLKATQRNFFHDKYKDWIKEADEVWDYDEQNIEFLKNIRTDIKLHILKPYKEWQDNPDVKKDIDILFYGALNKHRADVLNALSQKYKVVVLNNVFTNLDSYILRSKILLNIHYYYECSIQEQARLIRWIGAPCQIISEKSVKNYLGVNELNYEDIFKL